MFCISTYVVEWNVMWGLRGIGSNNFLWHLLDFFAKAKTFKAENLHVWIFSQVGKTPRGGQKVQYRDGMGNKILSVLPATRRTTRSDGSSCKTARGWPFCHSSRARRSISMFNLLLSLKSCHALHCTLVVQMYSGFSVFVTIIFGLEIIEDLFLWLRSVGLKISNSRLTLALVFCEIWNLTE